MEQIREKIAETLYKYQGLDDWNAETEATAPEFYEQADQILNDITLRRGGGVCPYCEGKGEFPNGRKCPKCIKGKLPVEEKSIGDLIKDFIKEEQR